MNTSGDQQQPVTTPSGQHQNQSCATSSNRIGSGNRIVIPVKANSRAARKLITWTDEKNAHLLILVDHVCKQVSCPGSSVKGLCRDAASLIARSRARY